MAVVDQRGPADGTISEMTPARLYLIVAGIYLVITGVAGFIVDQSFPVGAAARTGDSGMIFGIFETNGWHSLAGLSFGVIALYFYFALPHLAHIGVLIVAVPNAIVAIVFALEDPRTFWFASNGADAVVHTVLGVGGIVAAALTTKRASRTI